MPAAQLTQILYVDDEADMRMLAQLALEAVGGFQVTLCESGEEALAQAEAKKPQLILLDAMMPGMDGLQTLAALRAHPALAKIPAAFMTGKTAPEEIQNFIDNGAIGVIAKPFDPMGLAAQVQSLWEKHHV